MNILGIDIAKVSFDVHLLKDTMSKATTFSNDKSEFETLHSWLQKQEIAPDGCHVCMEATGRYYEAVAEYLRVQGYRVSVVNPLQIKAFRQSQLRRTKNDRQDAYLIALFCQQQQPDQWYPLSPEQKKLQALVRHLEVLEATCQQQRNRLSVSPDPAVTASLQRVIDSLETEIKQVKEQIDDHRQQAQQLDQQIQLLTSIPGIGLLTATKLLANMPHLADYRSAKQAAADAGLTPSEFQSGTSVWGKPRLSKLGKARIRKTLFLPALASIRCNPIIQSFRQRLLNNGKSKMVVVGAMMRKLLHIAYGLLKHNKPFDPNYAN